MFTSSSHLLILTSSHLLIFTSSHLLIFTSSHLLIFTSSHLHSFSSSHLHILTSSHLHICTTSHSFSLFLSSSYLHIITSSLSLCVSCSLSRSLSFLFFSLLRQHAVPTRRPPARPSFILFKSWRSSSVPPDYLTLGQRRVGLKAIEWGPAASEIYSLCFFDHVHGIMELRFFLGASGEGLFPKAPAKVFPKEVLPISPFHFV